MSEKFVSNVEKFVKTISYKGVAFDIIERPDVIWVGCIAYADNNTDPPFADDDMTLIQRYQALVPIPKQELINPAWSASISINYSCDNKPSGIMFAQETYSEEQDTQYELLTQPGGLWLRARGSEESDITLLGRKNHGIWEYFGILEAAAKENGFIQNPNVDIQVEYHCHAEYNLPTHTSYAYIPICKM